MAIFKAYGYSPDVITHLAVGTSLTTIAVTSISSLRAHNARMGCAGMCGVICRVAVIGSLLGAYVADLLHGHILALLIASMAMFMGIKMLLAKNKRHSRQAPYPVLVYSLG